MATDVQLSLRISKNTVQKIRLYMMKIDSKNQSSAIRRLIEERLDSVFMSEMEDSEETESSIKELAADDKILLLRLLRYLQIVKHRVHNDSLEKEGDYLWETFLAFLK